MTFYAALRPALFLLPPEKAHRAAICALQRGLVPPFAAQDAALRTQVAGLEFSNPVGLAPGFDKNAECFEGALRAGCGFVEIGTVTPRPQPGNPTPRLFRLVEHEAIINRLGFNNEGVDAAAARLAQRRAGGIIGGNIGKNKESVDAIADYVTAMRALYPYVDYITANISSPNTPGLRALQATDELHALITALQAERANLMQAGAPRRPLFVKIAPDCDDALLAAMAHVARSTALDGLIVSNTTLARDAVAGSRHAAETGGLSGKPLFAPSTEVLRKMYRLTEGAVPLIGVGGIASAADAYAKIRAGASLVQLYSALVYQGFGLFAQINRGLADMLARDGFACVADAVGRDAA
ncbi:MAG: quinone-dependent dihydroorotate dehydrogenase [Pseudomonadota bacterium]